MGVALGLGGARNEESALRAWHLIRPTGNSILQDNVDRGSSSSPDDPAVIAHFFRAECERNPPCRMLRAKTSSEAVGTF